MSQSIFAKTIYDERLGEKISPHQKALLEAYTPTIDITKSMGQYTTVLEDPVTKKIHYVMAWTHPKRDSLKTAYDVLEYDNITVDELEKENTEFFKISSSRSYDPKMERHKGV